jgi:hypothetical protein
MCYRRALDLAVHSTTAVVRGWASPRAGQGFHPLSYFHPLGEIAVPRLPLCATTLIYLAEQVVSSVLSPGFGYAVPLYRMQFQHTLSRLPIGVEDHNCRPVHAGYTGYMRAVLLPGRLR